MRFPAFLIILWAIPATAADLGTDGNTWPLTEPDLLMRIEEELARAETDGRLEQLNNKMKEQARKALTAPPSLGLPRATADKSWLHDPSLVVRRDIRTHRGELIAKKGTNINPLERIDLPEPLLFFDGTDAAQSDWALAQEGRLILTAGNPQKLMDTHDRRMFFDQKGLLTDRFNITALPARITQEGVMLKVEQIALQEEAGDG